MTRVYCSNCGIELPEWAVFCDRCGTRVRVPAPPSPNDPIEQVEADDTSVEPLWTEQEEPAEPAVTNPADETEFMPPSKTQETQFMDAAAMMDADDDESPDAQPDDAQEYQAEAEAEVEADTGTQLMDAQQVAERDEDLEAETKDLPDEDAEDIPEEDTADEPEDGKSDEESEADDEPSEAPDEPQPPADEEPAPSPFETLRTIDVGMDDSWPEAHGHYGQDRWDNRLRPSERRRREARERERERSGPNIALIAGLAAIALFFGLVIGLMKLGNRAAETPADDTEPVVTSKRVPKGEATSVIRGLDGWWKTGRTFDGRFWHLQNGLMETYAADGKLAAQTLLDPASVERMDVGPDDIEGAGYYLRDIGFYLVDDDPDTLHAIAQDGSTDTDANLLRTDPPAFVAQGDESEKPEPEAEEVEDPSEYLLPDAATRVYDTEELEAMSNHDLFVARNEIYARHGYVFETGELSTYFSSKSWYHPSEVFNEAEISEIERENVSAILAIEQARGSQYV